MSPLQTSNSTTADCEKHNTAEAQDKDFTTGFMDVLEGFKEEINKYINISMKTNSGMK